QVVEVLIINSRLNADRQRVIASVAPAAAGVPMADPALERIAAEHVLPLLVLPELNLYFLDFVLGHNFGQLKEFLDGGEGHVGVVMKVDDDFNVRVEAAHHGHTCTVAGGGE